MGFTLFQRLGKIQEWRDLMLLSWRPDKSIRPQGSWDSEKSLHLSQAAQIANSGDEIKNFSELNPNLLIASSFFFFLIITCGTCFAGHSSEWVFPRWQNVRHSHGANPEGRRKSSVPLQGLRRHTDGPEIRKYLLIRQESLWQSCRKSSLQRFPSGGKSLCSLS